MFIPSFAVRPITVIVPLIGCVTGLIPAIDLTIVQPKFGFILPLFYYIVIQCLVLFSYHRFLFNQILCCLQHFLNILFLAIKYCYVGFQDSLPGYCHYCKQFHFFTFSFDIFKSSFNFPIYRLLDFVSYVFLYICVSKIYITS